MQRPHCVLAVLARSPFFCRWPAKGVLPQAAQRRPSWRGAFFRAATVKGLSPRSNGSPRLWSGPGRLPASTERNMEPHGTGSKSAQAPLFCSSFLGGLEQKKRGLKSLQEGRCGQASGRHRKGAGEEPLPLSLSQRRKDCRAISPAFFCGFHKTCRSSGAEIRGVDPLQAGAYGNAQPLDR